jgi:predicted lipoprotein with Yx(FWY)xxD motif
VRIPIKPAVAVAALAMLALSACGSSKSPTALQPAAGTTASVTAASVTIVQNATKGALLADAQGRTLYQFKQDKGTTSACTGQCASIWPGYAPASVAGGPGVTASLLGTAAGQVAGQVTYAGHLLYTFSGDRAPGDVNGVTIPDWFAVSPTGGMIS